MPLQEIKEQQSEILNIKEIGQKIEGWYVGTHQGKFTMMYDIITTEGKSISLQPNRDIESKFQRIPLNSFVIVELIKRSTIGESKNEFKQYKVQCDADPAMSWEKNKHLYLNQKPANEQEKML